jgi:hypothetical protein
MVLSKTKKLSILGGLISKGQCILFSVVFTPPPPPATTAVFGSYLSSLYYLLTNTVYSLCELPYQYDRRGFVGAKEKTSEGLSVFNSSMFKRQQKNLDSRVVRSGLKVKIQVERYTAVKMLGNPEIYSKKWGLSAKKHNKKNEKGYVLF